MKKAMDVLKSRAIYVFLLVMIIFFTVMNPNFLTVDNLLNVAKQVSIFGIASVGMTYVILLGGIDLSTGSLISFVNIITAYFMVNMGMNPWLAILLALLISTAIGFFKWLDHCRDQDASADRDLCGTDDFRRSGVYYL